MQRLNLILIALLRVLAQSRTVELRTLPAWMQAVVRELLDKDTDRHPRSRGRKIAPSPRSRARRIEVPRP